MPVFFHCLLTLTASASFSYADQSLPPHVYSYSLKIFAHYGRVDWPKRAPGFLAQVLELGSTPETATLAANLLKIISEEWTSNKSRIKSSRRAKLKEMLASEVPNIVLLFSNILSALWEQNVREVQSSGAQSLDAYAEYQSNFENDVDAAALVKSVLGAYQSFIHWAPLNIVLSPAHIDVLFRYAMLSDTTSVLALDCLNEMMERNYVPTEMNEFLVQLHGASMSMIARLVKDEAVLANMDPDYIAKWTLYISLFVNYHLERASNEIPLNDFLSLLVKFTFFQPTPTGFLDCMDIWEIILTLLENLKVEGEPIDTFAEVVFRLVEALMNNLYFRHNAAQLEALEGASGIDESTLTQDEDSSELDEYLNAGISTISLAYSLFPEALQISLCAKVMEPIQGFFQIHTALLAPESTPDNVVFNSSFTPEQMREISWSFRDISTSVKAMALLGLTFAQLFESTFDDAAAFVNSLVELTNYATQHQLFRFSPEMTRLTAELFSGMRAFSEWFDTFWARLVDSGEGPAIMETIANTGSTGASGTSANVFGAALTSMFNCDLAALNSRSIAIDEIPANVTELVPLAAAWHVRVVGGSVRSPVLHPLRFPAIAQFMEELFSYARGHTSDVQQSICIGLTFMHLVPWYSTPAANQMWNEREGLFAAFFNNITQSFNGLGTAVIQKQELPFDAAIKEPIERVLVTLTGVVRESVGKLDRNGLAILWRAIQPSVEISISLFENYLDDLPMLFRLLQLHIEVFSVLAPLIPGELANNMLQTIITNLSGGNRLETLLGDYGGFGTAVAQRLLCLLKALVSRPNAPFLREAYDFCVERIWSYIENGSTAPDVEQSFYEIWCELLMNHYRYLSQNEASYRMSINCYLRAFQGQDLEIFKLVAHSLLQANNKSRIFSQDIFWNEGFSSYLATLLHVMIRRTHESLHDVILALLFAIIEGAGFTPFFDEFLPTFLQDTVFLAIPDEQKEALRVGLGAAMDEPSLTRGIANLAADLGFLSGTLRAE